MNPKKSNPTRSIVLAALFLALAFVLPMITGHVPQVGNTAAAGSRGYPTLCKSEVHTGGPS